MKLWQKAKKFLFHYSVMRNHHSKLGVEMYQLLLIVQALQVTSILTMLPLATTDRVSSTIYRFLRLFSLPSLLQVLTIPRYVALIAITSLLTINFLLTGFYIFRQKQDVKTHWFVTFFLKLSQIYQKLYFLPPIQLAMSEILQTKNTSIPAECSTVFCKNAMIALGSLLLGLAVWLYYQFLYINIPCYFEDGIESDNTQSLLDAIKGVKLVLIVGLAASGINSYVIFVMWGVFFVLDLIVFIVIGYHSNLKIEKTYTMSKGLQLTIYVSLLLSYSMGLTYKNYNSLLVALLLPISTKLIWNFKEIIKNRVNVHNVQRHKGNVMRIDRYLKSLYAEHKRHNSKGSEDLVLLSKTFITTNLDKPKEAKITTNGKHGKALNDLQVSAYQEAMDRQMIEHIGNTYSSLFSQQLTKNMNLSIVLSWILFLKDVKKSYIQAYIVLTQMRKTIQNEGSIRTRLQFEMIERMIKLEISSGADEKTISANKIFTFLDEAHSAQLQIEEYLSKILQYYAMMYSPIVKASEAKTQGQNLLLARNNIMNKLEKLTQENQAHRHTIQLYTFFIKAVVEEKSRSKIFELNRKLLVNNYVRSDGLDLDEKWDMSLEFYSNALTDDSGNYIAVFNLNSSNLGQIVRLSDNLMSLLGFSKPELASLSITSLETTLLNRKNMKTLQELLLQGDNPFEKVPEREKVLYLKNKSGRVLAFHYAAYLEIHEGNPCVVLYLRANKNTENNFVIFNLRKEGKIIGIGEGISTVFGEQWNKFSSVYDMIPEFPRDFHEASPPLFMQGARLNFSHNKTIVVNSLQSITSSGGGGLLFDYVSSVHHLSIIEKSYGMLSLSTSFSNRISPKNRIKYSEITDQQIISPLMGNQTHTLKLNSGVFSTTELMSPANLLLLQEARISHSRQESVKFKEGCRSPNIQFISASEETDVQAFKEKKLMFEIAAPIDLTDQENSMKTGKERELDKNTGEVTPSSTPIKRAPPHFKALQKEDSKLYLSDSSGSNKGGSERKRRKALFNAGASSRASGVTSAAHLTFLRYAILEKGDPAVIKTVYVSSAIIFVAAIICTMVTHNMLVGEYTTFAGFAAHAAFPGILKVACSSLFLSAQIRYGIQIGQFNERRSSWQTSATSISSRRFNEFLHTITEHLVNFDPETLSSNLKLSNYTMLISFPESSNFNREVNFYEANNIFMGYAQKVNLIKSSATTIDPNLVTFLRGFNLLYQETFLDPIRNILFDDAYSKYYGILTVLDYILIGCSLLTLTLTLGFFFVFRAFEKMETNAISKLCAVSKEDLDREISKIAEEYQTKFNPNLRLSRLLDFQPMKSKKSTGQKTIRAGRKIIGNYTPTTLIVVFLVVTAFLLSGSFIVANIVFKTKTKKILPFLTDIDTISAGLSAYPVAYSALMRLSNEIKVSANSSSFPLYYTEFYDSALKAFTTHQELLPRLRNFDDRIINTDITSNETKRRYQNLTSDRFCGDRDQNGTTLLFANLCKSSLKNLASQGLPDTAMAVMNMNLNSIRRFNTTPTVQTAKEILQAPDSWDFNYITTVVTNAIEYLLMSEQVDVSAYAHSLMDVTTIMLIISLIYNIIITVVIWVPIIMYLKKRFWIARNIFLLYPIRVLHSNQQIKQLFKKW